MKTNLLIIFLLLGLMSISCSDWLDATSDTEIDGEELFETESGFKDALIGVYISMTDEKAYGKNMTWYFNDLLVYPYEQNSEYMYIQQHRYTSVNVSPYIENMWEYSYKTIANINNLLKYLDKNMSVLNPINYNLIKGELLGLRAFVHFDLLRMYGLGNWAGDASIKTKRTIPYVTVYSKDETLQSTYDEIFKKLIDDIKESLKYLEEDPIRGLKGTSYYEDVNSDGFYNNRNKRMNYFAVEALAARVYMWEGSVASRNEAFTLAQNVIDHAPFKWIESSVINHVDENARDLTFSTEQLFSLEVMGLGDLFLPYCNTDPLSSAFKMNTDDIEWNIFDVYAYDDDWNTIAGPGAADVRRTRLMLSANAGLAYTSIKLRTLSGSLYRNLLPMIRISEMYYILAECYAANNNDDKAREMLDIVREHRGITDKLGSNTSVSLELTKEYMREFINEGQFMYYLKRLGISDPLEGNIYDYTIDLEKLLIPYPDTETEIGYRVQDK